MRDTVSFNECKYCKIVKIVLVASLLPIFSFFTLFISFSVVGFSISPNCLLLKVTLNSLAFRIIFGFPWWLLCWEFFYENQSSRYLLAQSQQCIYSKLTIKTYFTHCSDVSIVDFGQVIVNWEVFCYGANILSAKYERGRVF